MVLTGNDGLLNVIQWFALLFLLAGASLLAGRLGAGRAGQILAAIIVVTVPDIFLEASNTKNDVVEAMWVVIAAYWAITLLDRAPGVLFRMALLGISIGAAVLTKGTGVLFTAPIALIAVILLVRDKRMKAIMPLALMGAVALAINAGFFTRNFRQFGKIAGPETRAEGGYDLLNALKTPSAIASNVLREFAIEGGTPWPAVNARMDDGINRAHQLLGVNPHDQRTTFFASPYRGVSYAPGDEDRAGSPGQVGLLICSLPVAFLIYHTIRFRRVLLIYALAVGSLVIFCTLLRWQEWNVRLLFPVFCVAAPAIATIWTSSRLVYAAPAILLALLAFLLPTIAHNDRPLWGPRNVFTTPRGLMRLHWMPDEAPLFQQTAHLIASQNPRRIAFTTGTNSPDYLLMRIALDCVQPRPDFEYLHARAKVASDVELPPDLIIAPPDATSQTDPLTNRPCALKERLRFFSIWLPSRPRQLPLISRTTTPATAPE
jgi:hypothetical protein